jgi:hypothetical protein
MIHEARALFMRTSEFSAGPVSVNIPRASVPCPDYVAPTVYDRLWWKAQPATCDARASVPQGLPPRCTISTEMTKRSLLVGLCLAAAIAAAAASALAARGRPPHPIAQGSAPAHSSSLRRLTPHRSRFVPRPAFSITRRLRDLLKPGCTTKLFSDGSGVTWVETCLIG